MAVDFKRSCGICQHRLNEKVSDDSNIVQTKCGHVAHRSCFFDADRLEKSSALKVNQAAVSVFCFDASCSKSTEPNALFQGPKDHFVRELKKWAITVIKVPSDQLVDLPEYGPGNPDGEGVRLFVQDMRRRIRSQERRRRIHSEELGILLKVFKAAVIATTTACAFIALQSVASLFLGAAVGYFGFNLAQGRIEHFIIDPSVRSIP